MNIPEIRHSSKQVEHYLLSSKSDEEVCAKVIECLASGGRPVIVVGQLHDNPRAEECLRIVKTFKNAFSDRKEIPSILFPEAFISLEVCKEFESLFQIPYRPTETKLINAIDGNAVDMKQIASYRLAVLALNGDIPLDHFVDLSDYILDPDWSEDKKREVLQDKKMSYATTIRDRIDTWINMGYFPEVFVDSVRESVETALADQSLTFPKGFLDFSDKFLRNQMGFDVRDVAMVRKSRKALGIQTEAEALEKWPLVKAFSLTDLHNSLRTPDPVEHFEILEDFMDATHWTRQLSMAFAVRDNPCIVPVLQVGAYHADHYLPEFLALLGYSPFRLLMSEDNYL